MLELSLNRRNGCLTAKVTWASLCLTLYVCATLQAIAADTHSAELYANRAQTHLKLENFIEAVEDASKALELDPRLSKAHSRKGCAVQCSCCSTA